MIRDRQEEYYRVLGQANGSATATPWVEFMREALHAAIGETVASDQVSNHVRDQVIRLLGVLGKKEAGALASPDFSEELSGARARCRRH